MCLENKGHEPQNFKYQRGSSYSSTLLKGPLPHGCFLRFLNCANVTKSLQALHLFPIYLVPTLL